MIYATPVGRFHLGLLAPAIPGINSFDEFYDRTPTLDKRGENYKVVVGYNKYDRVLNKFIGRPAHWGSTTLGCRESEIDSVKKLVNVEGLVLMEATDFSWQKIKKKQKHHAFSSYINNAAAIDEFLTKLFKE